MPLVASSIPNLISGVSQQPNSLRLVSSCDEMINAYPSVVTGLNKRPPTEFIASMGFTAPNSVAAYLIDREGSYRFIVVLNGVGIAVYDMDGNLHTVSTPDGVSYITSAAPHKDFTFLTIGDTTFIANKTVICAEQTVAEDGSRVDPAGRGTIHITQSYANTNYGVYVNGALVANFTTANGITTAVESTKVIADQLAIALGTAGYSVATYGSTISIAFLPAGTKLRGHSSQGDKGIKWFTDTVQDFTQLPPATYEGHVVKVKGALKDNGDDYYVQYVGGNWVECAGYNTWTQPNPSTMPWKLVYNGGTSWTLSKHAWSRRNAGDATSNKKPSFIGSKINDMFFYTNRMGFLADENVILSQANVFENFYRNTLATIADNDRLDYAVFNSGVDILRFAVPYDKDLLLMSDRAQYRLTYQNYVGPKNTQVQFSTSFNVSNVVKPVNIGNSVYFVDDRPGEYQFSKVFEYFPKENRVGDSADEATAPVPYYVPSNITKITGSPRMNSAAMVLGTTNTDTIYLYKFFWNGQNKIQNAWHKWQFPDVNRVLWADFSKNYLYLLLYRTNGITFEKIRMDEQVYQSGRYVIDQQVPKSRLTLSYNGTTKKTTVTLPYSTGGTVELVGSYTDALPENSFSDFRLTVTKIAANQVTVDGDITGWQSLTAGIQYDMTFRFNQFFLRDRSSGTPVVNLDAGRLQMRYMTLKFSDTAYFTTLLKYPGRTNISGTFESKFIGDPSVKLGQTFFADGNFRIPLVGNSNELTLELHNDSPYPCAFASAEVYMIHSPKAKMRL